MSSLTIKQSLSGLTAIISTLMLSSILTPLGILNRTSPLSWIGQGAKGLSVLCPCALRSQTFAAVRERKHQNWGS